MDGVSTEPAGISNASTGHAVATARTLVGYSIEGAAAVLGIPISLLRDLESGAVCLNDELQERIEIAYGIRLSKLMTENDSEEPRTLIAYDAALGVLRVGILGVRFRLGLDDNDVLLRGFSSAVRRQRQIPPSVPLQLRRSDLAVLSTLLDLDDEELDQRARFWFGQTLQTGQSFTQMLRMARTPEDPTASAA